jgi:hypothetical protein
MLYPGLLYEVLFPVNSEPRFYYLPFVLVVQEKSVVYLFPKEKPPSVEEDGLVSGFVLVCHSLFNFNYNKSSRTLAKERNSSSLSPQSIQSLLPDLVIITMSASWLSSPQETLETNISPLLLKNS